eukprot:gene5387-gene3702
MRLSLEHDGATSLADLLVGKLADVASLHDAGHLNVAVAQKLRVAVVLQVNDGESLALLGL